MEDKETRRMKLGGFFCGSLVMQPEHCTGKGHIHNIVCASGSGIHFFRSLNLKRGRNKPALFLEHFKNAQTQGCFGYVVFSE